MATEHTTGIIGSQKGRQASATAGRNAQHGAFKKARPWIIAILTIIVPLLFWWRSDEVQNEMHKVATEQSATPTASAKWSQTEEDGSLPVGVWSETMKILPGCGVRFDAGNGTVYKTQYRLNSSGSTDWKDHVPGTFPAGDETRYMIIEKSVRAIPVRIVCR